MRYTLLGLLTLLAVSSCKNIKRCPDCDFSVQEAPAEPDYADLSAWAAHPAKPDPADSVPFPGMARAGDDAPVDVFFIHPTTYTEGEEWNAPVADHKLNEKTDETAILHQASVFNLAGRVYAPRYRQLTYGGFFNQENPANANQAFRMAYLDIRRAFTHYLSHENNGRPFILASHSQGAAHAIELVREMIDGKPLQDQLVAAYIVGWPVRRDTFQSLSPCDSPDQTGCYVSWCTYAYGYTPDSLHFYDGAVCVNPVTWRLDEDKSEQNDHQGLLMANYRKVHRQCVEAQVHGSILWVTKPDIFGKMFYQIKNYHIADINLFWFNVRENAALRATRFVEGQKGR